MGSNENYSVSGRSWNLSTHSYYNLFSKKNRPPPPPHLTKENVSVWMGWYHKGDKEIVREAVTKGIQELGVLYISLKKKQTLEESQEYFRDEVGK